MRKNIYKVLAAAFAMALVMASPSATIDSHAIGFDENAHDDTKRGEGDPNRWDQYEDSSNDSGSSEPAPAPEPAPVPSVDNGSSDSSSSYGNGSSNSSPASVSAGGNGTVGKANSATVNVEGGQKFRIVMDAGRTSCQVYHCGINKTSFAVTDAKGNAVAYSSVKLEKGEDGLWYMNITFAEGVDTEGFTVTATGDATYLSTTLGVSGIKINGVAALSTVPATEAK